MRRPYFAVLAAAFVLWASASSFAPERAMAQSVHANAGDPLAGDAFSSDPVGAVERARKLVAKGDLGAAIASLVQYVSAHSREIEPARYLGDLYYRKGDFATAERTYRSVLKFAPNDIDTHDRLGGIYAAQDRISEAVAEFQRSVPGNSAYGHLVELHRRLGDLDRYERDLRVKADGDPANAAAQYALGTTYNDEHKSSLAVSYLERALSVDQYSCPALSELGWAYSDIGRQDDAQRTLERCLAFDPNDYSASVNLGTVDLLRGRLDSAQRFFERANHARPDRAEALVDLGYVADVRRDWNLAVSFYLRAIATDPLARDAYVDLGYDYGEHRLFALAEAAYLKGLSVAPTDGRLHYLLGAAYSVQGKSELARVEYQAASSSDEPDVAHAALRDLSAP